MKVDQRDIEEAEAIASVHVLRLLARTEDASSTEKNRAIRVVASATGIRASEGPSTMDRSAAVDVEVELARLRSPTLKALTVRAAFAIAYLDEVHTDAATDLLGRVCAALEPEGDGLAANEATWVTRMRAVRRRHDAATDDFIHAVGRAASEEELSRETYASLVLDLDARKLEALRAVLLSD
jgi:hypothetical protein